MKTRMQGIWKDEQGVTALETAIILIAFVVVAAVFAFTVLSTGTFLTERSKEAAYAGLQEVRGSMELKGSVVMEGTGALVVFNLASVAGGSSVDLSKIKMTYRDSDYNQELTLVSTDNPTLTANQWTVTAPSSLTTFKQILATGDLARFQVKPPASIAANATFALEIKPQTGTVILLERTAPAQIDSVVDLH